MLCMMAPTGGAPGSGSTIFDATLLVSLLFLCRLRHVDPDSEKINAVSLGKYVGHLISSGFRLPFVPHRICSLPLRQDSMFLLDSLALKDRPCVASSAGFCQSHLASARCREARTTSTCCVTPSPPRDGSQPSGSWTPTQEGGAVELPR